MIEKDHARKIQLHALQAIRELSAILTLDHAKCSSEEYELLREGIGRSIGQIQMGVLEPLYRGNPELSDLDQFVESDPNTKGLP
jgi:hypothetical protein